MDRCRVVAEVGQAHDGSLGTAHAYIDAAADCGADAVKFQAHIAAAESTPDEPWRVRFSRQDENRYAYWRRMEFSPEAWSGLYAHAHERGLEFVCSPFSVEAVSMLRGTGIDVWKIASGEIGNEELLQAVIEDSRPVILSSGMSSYAELDRAVGIVRGRGCPLTVLQCTSMYPTPPAAVGLNVINELAQRYGTPTGLSDHSGTIFAGLAAAALGAALVEVHVVFSRASFGPDVVASLTLEELQQLTEGVRFLAEAVARPVDKDAAAGEMAAMRALFTRSVVIRHDLPVGHVLTRADLASKKPGTGMSVDRMPSLVGRCLARPLQRDHLLQESDLEPEGSV